MLKLVRIAVTGGTASGKSSVCRILRELGAFVVDADVVVHELIASDASVKRRIVHLLGAAVVRDGVLDRKAIADKVFSDSESLHALEQIIHPLVFDKIQTLYRLACERGTFRAFVVEMPLLFEIGQENVYDVVIVTIASEELMRRRYRALGHSDEEWTNRMHRQLPPEEKAAKARYVIRNEGSLSNLRKQVITISQEVFSS